MQTHGLQRQQNLGILQLSLCKVYFHDIQIGRPNLITVIIASANNSCLRPIPFLQHITLKSHYSIHNIKIHVYSLVSKLSWTSVTFTSVCDHINIFFCIFLLLLNIKYLLHAHLLTGFNFYKDSLKTFTMNSTCVLKQQQQKKQEHSESVLIRQGPVPPLLTKKSLIQNSLQIIPKIIPILHYNLYSILYSPTNLM